MILFLCYVFPPLAVLLMGRPFSAVGNFFLTSFGWVPGVRHALVCYADYKGTKSVKQLTRAINNPEYTKQPRASSPRLKQEREVVVVYDNPHVGKNGTYFRAKN
jgi:uncharacterized membrane protein YqaE (UPF0057 family)